MAQLHCKCGCVIGLSTFPNSYTYLYCAEPQFYSMMDAVRALIATHSGEQKVLEDGLSDLLRDSFEEVVKCPECGRLIVFEADNRKGDFYAPESG